MKEGQRKKVWQGKGNGTLWSDNSFEFRLPEEGSGWKKNILKKRGDAHLYETTGEKQQSLVAHLKVEKGCEDPAAELFEQLAVLTKVAPEEDRPDEGADNHRHVSLEGAHDLPALQSRRRSEQGD